MLFRNLRIYRLKPGMTLSNDELDTALQRRKLGPCGSFDMKTMGWVSPRGEEDPLVFSVERQQLIKLGVEERILPAAVIRQQASARANAIEREQGRKVGRKEMREITDRVHEELLPKTLTRRRYTLGWIDPIHGWLVIDAGSDARADEFIETLQATADTLAPRLLQTQISPLSAMTGWLATGEAPTNFTLDLDLELRSADEAKAAIRYVHHTLDGPEIANHIAAGKVTTKLGMTWNDRLSFSLTDKFLVKRLSFLDIAKEQATAENSDDLFAADFALMSGVVAGMLEDMVSALGGHVEQV